MAIELTSFFQFVIPVSESYEYIVELDEKITSSLFRTISDEVKKSVESAYNDSAEFLDQIICPVSTLILYTSAAEVIANK